MGRRKVRHQFISDNSTRRVTFKKRKNGLLKKLKELTILCGVHAFAIIYSEYNEGPELWPNRNEVCSLLNRLSELPVEKQTKYKMNQNDIMNRMVQDAEKKIEKVQFHKRSMDLGVMAMFKDLSTVADYSEELNKAAEVFEKKFKVVRERIEAVKAGTPIIKRE